MSSTHVANPDYSLAEEIAHSVTHGIGIVLSIVGLAVLVAFAALKGTAWHIVGCSVFGATMVLAYTASTVYPTAMVVKIALAQVLVSTLWR